MSYINHPQIRHRMNQGETYFIKVEEEGYSTKTGPMSKKEAMERVMMKKKRGEKASIINILDNIMRQ